MSKDVYSQSFSRNIGILTSAEQHKLQSCCVAIAGMGGIGSNTAVMLARMGVGRFRIADFDRFEYANINRQYGAFVDTIGRAKTDVVAAELKRINPNVEIHIESAGFSKDNAERLLSGAHLTVDAIDFYSIEAHLEFHRQARQRKLYVLMGSPVGFSACLQVFDPDGMNIEEYCGIEPKMLALEKQLRYACGVVPNLAHVDYFDVSRGSANTNFLKKTGPSLACATTLAASLVASEAMLILLNRRKPRAIPYTFQFDPYTFRYEKVWLENGMKSYDVDRALGRIPDRASLIPMVLKTLYKRRKAHRAKVNGAQLYYEIEGEGENLLLLPPLGADSSFWARQVQTLSKHFRVITFDPRGTGFSSDCDEKLSTEQMAQDAAALLKELKVKKAHVLGLAMGALTAQHLAADNPQSVDRLILAAAYAKADDHIAGLVAQWQQTAREEGMEDLFDSCVDWLFSPDYVNDTTGEVEKLRTFFSLNLQKPASFVIESAAGVKHDATRKLHAIQSPTLVLHGEADRVVNWDLSNQVASGIPGARMKVMERAPHFMSWEEPEVFNAEVLRFLTPQTASEERQMARAYSG